MQDVTDWALQLRYRTTAARILDAHRKFLDASVRFYELSLAQVTLFSCFCVACLWFELNDWGSCSDFLVRPGLVPGSCSA